jgi:NADPH-dependent 2,4-dienoyl-CoA reductase/sulfur reductase-like enzyme
MTSNQRVVVVGASIGGLTAAESLRAEGFEGGILLLGDEANLPYSRPPLSKQLLLSGWGEEQVTFRSKKELDNLGIQFSGRTRAICLDLSKRQVETNLGYQAFDELIIATGTKARRMDSEVGVQSLRTLEDALLLRNRMTVANRIAVIGSGVLGSEIASAGKLLGAAVTLVGRSNQLSFGAVGTALSSRIQDLHSANNVNLHLGSQLLDIFANGEGASLRFSEGEDLVADLVVAAIGATPCTEWLEGSGLTLSDGIVCDRQGMAAAGVYAVGDVASWPDPFNGIPTRVEHQSNAIEQAIAVAGTIMRGSMSSPPVPFFWSEIHGVKIKAYGWFDGQPLVEFEKAVQAGSLLASRDGVVNRGIVSWDCSPKDFMKARGLLDESIQQQNHLLTKEQS